MPKHKKPSSGKKQLDRIEKKEDTELKKIDKLAHEVEEIEKSLKKPKKKALRKIDYKKVGGKMPTDFSIVAGSTGNFAAQLTPPGGAQAAGTDPVWTASDSSVSLSPSADGMTLDATPPTGFAAPSFDLTVSAVSSDPAVGTVTKTHTITVSAAALASIDFTQVS